MNIPVSENRKNFIRVAECIKYLSANRDKQPSLSDMASHIGLSEYHLQRIFSEWAGVTPKQFLQYLTKEHAKKKLHESSVMNAALASGLSGSSRLHDLLITCEGITPGEYKSRGKNLEIFYGVHNSPFGYCLIAKTRRSICKLAFIDGLEELDGIESELFKEWECANIVRNDSETKSLTLDIFNKNLAERKPLRLLLKGSAFQLQVWEALLSIPFGGVASYQQVADSIGKKPAVRAVASAVARNNIGFLIPCHRVIRGTGEFNQYRWGLERKQAVIGWEGCVNDSQDRLE